MTVGIAYIPVLHKGYRDFCEALEREGVTALYLVSDELLAAHAEFDYLNRKDRIRALSPDDIAAALAAVTGFEIRSLDLAAVRAITPGTKLCMPNEDVSHVLAREYFAGFDIAYQDVFLRWHRDNVGEDKVPESTRSIAANEFISGVFTQVLDEAGKSFDWWRQVGAALVKDGNVIALAHNAHMPDEQLPNVFGDTRALFSKGDRIEYVTSAHAEVGVIGEAAQRGIATEGAELYVTDFPCPYCARLIAKTGIKKLYFLKGYAVLEGDAFLKDAGVEIIQVEQ